MNKIKENVRNTSKKKILISILLMVLMLFTILSPLNSSKSGKIEVNALSAPNSKTLDLNGVTYKYQTSLNELKNNYYFFNHKYNRDGFIINQGTETTNIQLLCCPDNDTYGTGEPFDAAMNYYLELINNSFTFYDINNNEVEVNALSDSNNTSDLMVSPFFEFDISTLGDYSNLKIDFANLFLNNRYVSPQNYTGSFYVTFVYVLEDFNVNGTSNEKYMYENSIFFNIAFSRPIEYTFSLGKSGYELREIICVFESDSDVEENAIVGRCIDKYIEFNYRGMLQENYIAIDNLSFIDSEKANIISYYSYFDYTISVFSGDVYPVFKGNILLSNDKYDTELNKYLLNNLLADNITQPLGRAFFGGYNAEKKPRTNIYFNYINAAIGIPGVRYIGAFNSPQGSAHSAAGALFINTLDKIEYSAQNQLLYLQDLTNLRINNNNYSGAGLSAQVENVLYNVNLVGNNEVIQKEENVQEDFINLLKTSALGTFIGLIVGILIGNPALGAIIGGATGLGIGIIPLVLDALNLTNTPLYNIFKSIVMLFVDIFDALINFALNFITNPIILIIVVVAILLYIFVIRKFKK